MKRITKEQIAERMRDNTFWTYNPESDSFHSTGTGKTVKCADATGLYDIESMSWKRGGYSSTPARGPAVTGILSGLNDDILSWFWIEHEGTKIMLGGAATINRIVYGGAT